MRTRFKRLSALAAAAAMVATAALTTACQRQQEVDIMQPITFPLEEQVTLSWWFPWDNTYTPEYSTVGDHPFMQELQARTNVQFEFIHPTSADFGQQKTEYMNQLAAGNIPDMVTHGIYFPDHSGSTIDGAIDDGIYIRLNELVDVHMPNFKTILNSNSIISRQVYTEQGNLIYIPKILLFDVNDSLQGSGGLVIRKDMLDELQLDVPETVADWYNVLTRLKISGSVPYPLEFGDMRFGPWTGLAFFTGYGTYNSYYLGDDGKIRFGLLDDAMRDYVQEMAKWNAEGLLALEYFDETVRASDDVAAWVGGPDELESLPLIAQNPNYELIGVKYPTLEAGKDIEFLSTSYPLGSDVWRNLLISADCQRPDVALAVIDQFYTEESFYRTSYGVEGEDYTIDADGNVQFTDKIKNDPDGMRFAIAHTAFLDSFWYDSEVFLKYTYSEKTQESIEQWARGTRDRVVPFGKLTDEESEAIAQLGDRYGTQVGGLNGFVRGDRPMTEWDAWKRDMADAGVMDELAIYQQAYDRYLESM